MECVVKYEHNRCEPQHEYYNTSAPLSSEYSAAAFHNLGLQHVQLLDGK